MPTTDPGLDQAILSTKVHRPRVAPERVLRERLFERLDRGTRGPLTVVSAPTGFGKTTLVADWLGTRWQGGSGWVSLGASDNDRALFWGYLCAAFEQAGVPGARALASAAFAPGPVPTEALVAPMLAELGAVEEPVVLVLDDVHLLDDAGVLEALRQLVEGAPEAVRWVLVSRRAAPFPVGRLRARGLLVEISVDDLRFDRVEATGFLASRFNVAPSDELVDRLVRRTEGWAAGLQLASLTVGEGDDPESAAAAFTGDHPWVTELLVEEVLDRQPPGVRDFLLRTSVLDRFNAELAARVVGVDDAAALLRQVHRRGLFLVELDGRREWFRYHHLFGEMLRARLAEVEPDAPKRLHGAASRWFDGEGLLEEAVQHAHLSDDPEWSAEVIERGWRRMDRSFRSERWLSWARRLPTERVRERPVLALGMGWALLDIARLDEAEPFLTRAQEWLDGTAEGPGPRVSAEADYRSMGGFLSAGWAYLAQARGDLEATERHAREALERLPPDDPFYRGIPAVTVGLAQWARGELDAAVRSFDDGLHAFRAAGNSVFEHGALYVMAEVRLEQGWLAESSALFAEAEALEGDLPTSDEVRAGRAELLVERGRPEEAAALLDSAGGDAPAPGGDEPRLAIARAELAALRGDSAAAHTLIDTALAARLEAARVPRRRPLEARRARLQVLDGDLAGAERWARAALPGDRSDELVALAELALARCLRGDPALAEAEARIAAIDEARAGDAGPRLAVEGRLLRARLAEHRGDRDGARRLVAEAVERAATDELVRVLHRSAPPELLTSVLAAEARWSGLRERLDTLAAGPTGGSPLEGILTRREVEVLGLVREGLRNKDIAKRLFISLSTVKRHIANIYAKLGVTHRTAAVARLEELERG